MFTLRIEFTKHAKEQMIDRGFSRKEIEEGLKRGTKIPQNGKFISVYSYYKIVYKKIKDVYYIITLMYRW
ncbi:DUF4258 domain-containing protein [Candidatus Woesearchaeota archaeon]|nr:DUF4258 domain-containing protein [Candidatus Woesearchaeota archaeon]